MTTSDYLALIISPLLSKPEAIEINSSSDDMGVLLTLIVAKEDMGSIIGREGETAKCVRHLVRIAGIKQNARVSVKILEPDGTDGTPRKRASDRELLA